MIEFTDNPLQSTFYRINLGVYSEKLREVINALKNDSYPQRYLIAVVFGYI